jgi:hypothetical protein
MLASLVNPFHMSYLLVLCRSLDRILGLHSPASDTHSSHMVLVRLGTLLIPMSMDTAIRHSLVTYISSPARLVRNWPSWVMLNCCKNNFLDFVWLLHGVRWVLVVWVWCLVVVVYCLRIEKDANQVHINDCRLSPSCWVHVCMRRINALPNSKLIDILNTRLYRLNCTQTPQKSKYFILT